jgi:hypothetical protein
MITNPNRNILLIGGSVIVLAAVVIGVRSLTGPKGPGAASERAPRVEKTEEEQSAGGAAGSLSPTPRVTSLGSGTGKTAATGAARSGGPKPTGGGSYSGSRTGAATTESIPQTAKLVVTPAPAETPESEEAKQNARKISDLVSMFKNEKNSDARIDLADELGLIDDPSAVRQILELEQSEADPEVKEALLNALTGLDALENVPEAIDALDRAYKAATDVDVKSAAIEALGEIPTAAAAKKLSEYYNDPTIDPSLKLTAAEKLLSLHSGEPALVPSDQFKQITDQLKIEFQASNDPAFKQQAAMALAMAGKESLPFFQQALTTETDPAVKNLLEKLTKLSFAQ